LITLTIQNNKSVKFEPFEEHKRPLKKLLSFVVKDAQFTPAGQKGWDGVVYLVNSKGEFPSGLLSNVEAFCKENNLPFQITDKRKLLETEPVIQLQERLKELNLVPRNYQSRAANLLPHTRQGIIRACTGSGKSLIAALMAAKINKPTIIYVIGLDLLNQFHKLFTDVFQEEIGYIGNGVCKIRKFNIASVWTIGRALDIKPEDLIDDDEAQDKEDYEESNKAGILRLLATAKLHIIDECHISTTTTIRSIHKAIDPEYIFGLSGTPYRDDNSDLMINGILGPIVTEVPASELISQKILAQPEITFLEVPKQNLTDSYPTIYKEYIVDNDARNQLVVSEAIRLQKAGFKPLILYKTINHGKTLFKMISEQTDKVRILSGKDSLDKRDKVKAEIYDNKIDIILASTIFDIGVSIDCLSALILAGGGKSSIRALQRIGRVIRSYPGKTIVPVIDFYDCVKYLRNHSLSRAEVYKSEKGFILNLCPQMKSSK